MDARDTTSSAWKTSEKPKLHARDHRVKPAGSHTLRKLTDKGTLRSPRGRGAGVPVPHQPAWAHFLYSAL